LFGHGVSVRRTGRTDRIAIAYAYLLSLAAAELVDLDAL
jgi:hypothetical protein